MCSKAVSIRQGGMGLLWKDGDSRFKVESVAFKNRPNVVTFQVVTGDCWYYVVGVNIPPNCHLGVDEIWAALEACHTGCTPIVLGDLNANGRFPRDKREETIVDLLDKYNVTDLSRRFKLRAPHRFEGHVTPAYLEPEMGTGERGHEALLYTRLFYGARRWAKQSEGSGV
jgi:hypothetical protein